MRQRTCTVGGPMGEVSIGQGHPLAIIGGPCTLESLALGLEVGQTLAAACAESGLPFIFKASFDKANRSSIASSRGPGMSDGLEWLARIRDGLRCPVTTDIHLPGQAPPVAEVAGLIQIPAFLCRQTDLLVAAGEAAAARDGAVNVKKGQFLSPREMLGPLRKLHEAGCGNAMLTERGTFFGYHRLVTDFIGLGDLMELDCSGFSEDGPPPVCFDATHSTQLPGSGEQTGGRPERAPMLARAAVAAGVHALFLEAHPNPAKAASDAATQLPLDVAVAVVREIARLRELLTSWG
ncbi:MAG: 3-deoxy-8-phosphooctulonate synthase [Planctomycetota bacterium]